MRCRFRLHSAETMGKLQRFVKTPKGFYVSMLCMVNVQVKKEMTIPGEDEPTGIIQPLKENIALGLEQAKTAAT